MNNLNRRIFLIHSAALTSATLATQVSAAENKMKAANPGERLSEADSYPKSMGFKLETKNVDNTRYPRHTTEQYCGRCQLFEGNATEGECSFYGGRIVPAGGWCKNFKLNKSAA
jgi:hypothetical protein